MPSIPLLFRRIPSAIGSFLATGAMLVCLPAVQALPPKAPTNVGVSITRAADADTIAGVTNAKPLTDYTTFVVRWSDNAIDEDGYIVQYRGGNAGPFYALTRLGPNSQSGLGISEHFANGVLLQFQVLAFRHNGSRVEYSASPIFNYITPTTPNNTFGAPTDLTATLEGDGVARLRWRDNSGTEVNYQILVRKRPGADDAPYESLGFVSFNTIEVPVQTGFEPETTYEFKVVATRDGQEPLAGGVAEGATTASLTFPVLAAPTGLTGSAVSESQIRLEWVDNSKNETGYVIEYQETGETEFSEAGVFAANTKLATITVPSGTSAEWRVRAFFQATESSARVLSEPTAPAVQITTAFPAPSELTATTSPAAGAVDLTWKDNSTAEGGFQILTRPEGQGEFALAELAAPGTSIFDVSFSFPPGTTTARIQSRLNEADSTLVPLEKDIVHEFRVRAFAGGNNSTDSNVVTAMARDGFTGRFYHPATVGVEFGPTTQYELATSEPVTSTGPSKDWNVANLAEVGLAFNNSTGVISGTPSKSGIFNFPMTAKFDSGWEAQGMLTMRILRQPSVPEVNPTPDFTVGVGGTLSIPLRATFRDSESEMAVRLATSKGNIDLILYPSLAPKAVENFMAYVEAGDYDGTAFHRSIPSFVVQGGGFRPVSPPTPLDNNYYYRSVSARTSPLNEPGISNVTGTIASAKQANNPNSATHDFFLNLVDNTDRANPQSLDNQNGGFTAFGRLATSIDDRTKPLAEVYPVLGAIAALPRGNYTNQNSDGATYDAGLDKRVVVDGSRASFTDWPMDVTGSAPADMDASKNVVITTAREIPVLTFAVTSPSSDIVAAKVEGEVLRLTGLQAGLTNVTVNATDLEGKIAEDTLEVRVTTSYRPPIITRQPVSQFVAAGAKATLSVMATGTSLLYQWRKQNAEGEFEDVPGATGSSFVVNQVQPSNAGTYEVQVYNQSLLLTSNAARIEIKTAPSFTLHPQSKVVEVGKALELETGAVGAPDPTFAWLRGTATVAGQTKSKLQITSAKLADGGIYKARASNVVGKPTSNPANVYVVDKAIMVTTSKPGGKVVFKAPISGPIVSYQWQKDGASMGVDDGRITGKQGATLTVSNASAADNGEYTCVATVLDGLGDVVSGVQKLAVVNGKPVLATYTADAGVVGFEYQFDIPTGADANNTATKFAVSGLPPGLKLDAATGRISGRPTQAGVYPIRSSITNAAGTSAIVNGTIEILPVTRFALGTFQGAIAPSPLNGNNGGRLDLSIVDTGSFSGKVTLAAETHTFSGLITYLPGVYSPQAAVEIPRRGKSALLLVFFIDPDDGYLSGYVSDGLTTSSVSGFRLYWHASFWPVATAGIYTAALSLPSEDSGKAEIPQGIGYASISGSSGGTVSAAFRLADGSSVTCGSLVGPLGEFIVFQMLYKNTGSIFGLPIFGLKSYAGKDGVAARRVSGEIRWSRSEQASATERSYRAGFGPVSLDMVGRNYYSPLVFNPPLANPRVFGLPSGANNARLDFSEGGLAAAAINPDTAATVNAFNGVEIPAPNPAKVRAGLNLSSGLYTGYFELADTVSGKAVKRSVTFQGVLIPEIPETPAEQPTQDNGYLSIEYRPGVAAQAPGYFTLAQLPSAGPPATTISTSAILSGKVEIKPAPISVNAIVTTPATGAVNPGATYKFQVTAVGQGTLTYQWRRNGSAISGATLAEYEIATVAEHHEGSYDVVVSNSATSGVSNPVTLSVNDPVSNIVIARNPDSNSVATGGTMTLTASSQGTGPFTYQWLKDGNPIQGATAASYVISTATATAHDGSYSVIITNSVSTDGVTSAAVDISVVDGVSNVVAERTPADTEIGAGETVTFTVTASGSAPLTYQWRKDGAAISGATNATYTISPTDPDDTANYDVIVKNAASIDGVASNVVALVVTNSIINVAVSRNPPTGAVAVGSSVTFTASAQGADPKQYQWRRGDQDIPGAINQNYTFTATLGDAGDYTVIVYNEYTPSGRLSGAVNLAVAEPIQMVTIAPSPGGNVNAGTPVTLTANSDGTSPFFYQWRKDGVEIPGATGKELKFEPASESDSGTYDVTVTNAVSTGTQSFTLLVNP